MISREDIVDLEMNVDDVMKMKFSGMIVALPYDQRTRRHHRIT
jgi:uncharacterized membrane protein